MIFLILLALPFVEIALAIWVFKTIGFANGFFLWLAGTVLGFGLLKTSGLRVSMGLAQAMREGKRPELAALEGALVGFAGFLFLMPGYLSDMFAVLLLVRPLRRLVAKRLIAGIVTRSGLGGFRVFSTGGAGAQPHRAAEYDLTDVNDASRAIIDVEPIDVDDESKPRNGQ
ncbi:MAG: FxsA family protein [Bdellovibrionales bacterium]|jgi:UPF0716 protein FxsA|nr:FxsA family protein [Bdellovibrionales bacterium]